MNCPICGSADCRVVDTRASGDGIRRRRACMDCGHRFTTFERIELRLPLVVKSDGRREPFSRDKVLAGLRLACRKRPVSAEDLEAAASRVEQQVLTAGAEIQAADVGTHVMTELKGLDKVAYLRFASVYLDVQTPSEFQTLLAPWLRPEDEEEAADGGGEDP
ncbi:MAG: transcriptional repressor NrdR [Alphaproteobacteria bacterium]|nr:transcriptional repressor NrdR [Alphaproteobacteria bacterium]